MKKKDIFKVPCIDKNGKLVSVNDCQICRNRDHCDTYITLIEEDPHLEDDAE